MTALSTALKLDAMLGLLSIVAAAATWTRLEYWGDFPPAYDVLCAAGAAATHLMYDAALARAVATDSARHTLLCVYVGLVQLGATFAAYARTPWVVLAAFCAVDRLALCYLARFVAAHVFKPGLRVRPAPEEDVVLPPEFEGMRVDQKFCLRYIARGQVCRHARAARASACRCGCQNSRPRFLTHHLPNMATHGRPRARAARSSTAR